MLGSVAFLGDDAHGGLAHAPRSALVLVAELAGSYDLLARRAAPAGNASSP